MATWSTRTYSISLLPYRDVIFSLFNAPAQQVRQIVRNNFAILMASATLDAFDKDIEWCWNQGDRTMSDYLWRVKCLLQRARDVGIDAAVESYAQPIDQVRDVTVLLERSPTPFQMLKGITELFAVLNTGDELAVYRVVSEYIDQFRQPLSAVYVSVASRSPQLSSEIGVATLERAAQLLDAIARNQDIRDLVTRWQSSKQDVSPYVDEPTTAMLEYLTSANWYEAQQCVKRHYNVLLSNFELAALRSATRNAWQADRRRGILMWKHLRLLEYSRVLGIDVAFDKLIWSPDAELFWHSEREINTMEAANIPFGNLNGLAMFIAALASDSEQAILEWADRYWDEIQHPWVAGHVRYLADVATVEGNESDRQAWEALADWLDEIRGEDPQAMLNQRQWAGLPGTDGLTLL